MSHLPPDVKPGKLFAGSCISLIATAMTFAVLSSITNSLKEVFLLTNEQVGMITGAGLWGFPLSILIFGSLCSTLGMRFLLRLCYIFFIAGVGMMIMANGFWMLLFGALTIAFANGLVEGACNPLVASIYPDRKVEKLNQFHVWFPGGIVIGGLACYFMDNAHIGNWQVKLAMILVPAAISAAIMMFEKFPPTERASSGVSFGEMVSGTFSRPFFWLMFVCMMLTASTELGPNRWMPAIMENANLGSAGAGMLLLVWTSLLMAILRQCSGHAVERLSPTGMLLTSAILSCIGLIGLSTAKSTVMIFAADTVFALGVCYFWPTMLGVVSERVPRGGEFALALMGVAGNLAVGLVTIPLMGTIADVKGHTQFDVAKTVAVVQQINDTLPGMKKEAKSARDEELNATIDKTVALAGQVLTAGKAGSLPPKDTANVLRGVQQCAPDSDAAKAAKELLGPAELYGGRWSFYVVSGLAAILVAVFGLLYVSDRMQGGYKAEVI